MALFLPNGTTLAIAATYGDPITVTAISNANPGVVSVVDNALALGDIIEVTSGWSQLSGRVARVTAPLTDSVSLEGIDTTDTSIYPAGASAGSIRKVDTWQAISQVLDSSQSGGDQQYFSYNFLEDLGDERQMPTQRSAKSLSFTLADDPSLGQNAVLDAATASKTPRIVRAKLPNGAFLYWNVYVSFDSTPTLTRNQGMAVKLDLSLAARITRYAA